MLLVMGQVQNLTWLDDILANPIWQFFFEIQVYPYQKPNKKPEDRITEETHPYLLCVHIFFAIKWENIFVKNLALCNCSFRDLIQVIKVQTLISYISPEIGSIRMIRISYCNDYLIKVKRNNLTKILDLQNIWMYVSM